MSIEIALRNSGAGLDHEPAIQAALELVLKKGRAWIGSVLGKNVHVLTSDRHLAAPSP